MDRIELVRSDSAVVRVAVVRVAVVRVAIAVVLAAIAVACGGDNATGPAIEDIMPLEAAPGATVEILGQRFCGDDPAAAGDDGACAAPPDGLLSFGGEPLRAADIAGWRHERITVTVPDTALAGETVVVVTVNGVPSNPFAFGVE